MITRLVDATSLITILAEIKLSGGIVALSFYYGNIIPPFLCKAMRRDKLKNGLSVRSGVHRISHMGAVSVDLGNRVRS